MSTSPHRYLPKALIFDCELECDEFSEQFVEKIRNTLFDGHQDRDEPQEVQLWFKAVTQGPNAIRSMSRNKRMNSRLISWKTGKKFLAENLFFRTIDTSRLLPVGLADFRIQWYAHKEKWAWIDGREKKDETPPRLAFQLMTLSGLMFPFLIMRNMHDYAGGDIPVILTNWHPDQTARAFDYWVEISKDGVSDDEKRDKFLEIDGSWCLYSEPCFLQVDLLVRSLFSDPAVGYVPRFIVFLSSSKNAKACALFANPSFCPPQELTASYPRGCGARNCQDSDCGLFDFNACRSLAAGSEMVRKDKFPKAIVRCNLWTCNVEEKAGHKGPSKFQTCQRCAEVLYCSRAHQEQDWKSHKRVCEARPVNV